MADTNSPWQELDRSSAAGRALWRLYGGDPSGKAAGNTYSAVNRASLATRSMTAAPSSPAATKPASPQSPQKAEVKVPKVGKSASASKLSPQPIRGKRSARSILADLRAEQQATLLAPPQPPKGPCLDDKEKARLAEKMEFNGKDPEPLPASHRLLHGSRKEREQQELEGMFEDTLDHIQACKARLLTCDDGSASWELAPEAVQIKKELSRHVDDLRRIDALMSDTAG